MEIPPAVVCFYSSLPICKISNLLFCITLDRSDHIHLKWLNVTSIASSLHYLTHNSTHCWDKTSWLTIWYHLVTWGVQLIFPLHRWYRPSVALWWYVLLRILVELFVSQGLLFHEGNYLFDEHRLIYCNIPCFFWK